eukprot:45609-Eustigmatos_ZCMA.PRE.1
MEDQRGDYAVLVKGVMAVGGEYMATEGQYHECIQALGRKHAGLSAALYGRLQYMLLVAFTGRNMSVHAIRIIPEDRGEESTVSPRAVVTLVEPFEYVHA